MALKLKAAPMTDSEDDDSSVEKEIVKKRVKVDKDRFKGGIIVSSESEEFAFSKSLSAAEKKGLKEIEELERELDLKNTFSKETNRRDEDAEMNKYINEQIRLRREAAKKERLANSEQGETSSIEDNSKTEFFSMPVADGVDDILLQSLSKDFSSTTDEKSEAMLSSQMLNGIPEVDLGLNERIRTIEATEEAKLRLATEPRHSSRKSSNNFRYNRKRDQRF